MSGLYRLTARELRAQSPAIGAALVTATLPWVAPLLPLMAQSGSSAADVRAMTAAVLSTLLGLALAAFCGAGLLARDLADGRLGFFLALPLRASVIWSGRLIAAILLVYGGIAVVALPPLLAAPGALAAVEGWPRENLVPILLLPLLVLLLAHHLAVALRSRSPWMLLDLGIVAGAAVITGRCVARLEMAGAPREAAIASAGATLVVAVTLAVAGGVALRRGALLMGRVHRTQMTFTSAGLALAAVAVAAYAGWAVRPTLAAVETPIEFLAAPRGPWIAELAQVRHRPSFAPWLLVDPQSGRSLALPSYSHGQQLWLPVTFAADGKSFLALRPLAARFGPAEVQWVDLSGGGTPRVADTGIVLAHPQQSALCALGDRLATVEASRLQAWSGQGSRQLAAAALPNARFVGAQSLRFAGEELHLARIVYGDKGTLLQRFALSLRDHRLRRPADVALADGDTFGLAMSSDGEHVLVSSGLQARGGLDLYGFDAAAPAVLLAKDPAVTGNAVFLSGERVAVAIASHERLTLRVHAADGTLLKEVALGSGHEVLLGPAWDATHLPFTAVVPAPLAGGRKLQGELREVDVDTGSVRVLGGRLRPLLLGGEWSVSDDAALVPAGAPATRLFVDPEGQLVRIGADGTRRAALQGGS